MWKRDLRYEEVSIMCGEMHHLEGHSFDVDICDQHFLVPASSSDNVGSQGVYVGLHIQCNGGN